MPNLQFNTSSLSPLFAYLKKQQENEKSRSLMELSITFIIISFFLLFAIKPTSVTISTLVGDIKSKEILTAKMKTKIDQIIVAQDNFASVQEKYYLVDQALPISPNFISFYNYMDLSLTANGILVDKLDFLGSDKNYFTTKISTSSSFSSSLLFVTSLLERRRLLNLPKITFLQDKDLSSSNKVNIFLPIEMLYWQNPNEQK